jgi:hypothetical protein
MQHDVSCVSSTLLSTEQAQRLSGEVYDMVRPRLPQRSAALMDDRRVTLQATVSHTASEFEALNLRSVAKYFRFICVVRRYLVNIVMCECDEVVLMCV